MGNCFGPKCFLASSFILLTILSIYGIVGTVMNFQQASKMHTYGDWPFNLRPLFYAFAIIQILFPLAGLLGLFAACKNEPMFLYGSGSVLLGIFTSCCVFGSVSLRLNSQSIIDEFYMTVRKNLNDSKMLEWMDDVQWQYMCCGVYSYVDWHQFGEDENVPSSCCRRDKLVPKGKGRCGIGLLRDNESMNYVPSKVIYEDGCGSKVAESILSTARHLGIEILSAGVVSFVVAIFLYACVTKLFVNNGTCSGIKTDVNGNVINGKDNQNSPSPTNISSSVGGVSNIRDTDPNNNSSRTKKKMFPPRDRNRVIERRRKRANGSSYRMNQPFGPINSSHTKFLRPSSKNEINGNISASKSFILGEAQSNLLSTLRDGNDPELLRKNVDMLWYQSVDKNLSTLSTTPNDISSLNFPSIWQNRRHIFGQDLLAVLSEDEQNTVYTLVSERPFTPSLSQNCSISIFNNQGKAVNGNGEGSTNVSGQGSTAAPNINTKTQRLTTPLQEEKLLEEVEPDGAAQAEETVPAVATPTTSDPAQTQPTILINEKEKTESSKIVDDYNSTESLINQVAGSSVVPPPPTTATTKYQNPTSGTVRSTTLATIHEESESAKGSPTKAASPASGFMSPEGVTPQPTKTDLSNTESVENQVNSNPIAVDTVAESNNLATVTINSKEEKHSIGDNENFPSSGLNVAVTEGFKIEGNEESKIGVEVIVNIDSLGESELRDIAKSQKSQVAPDMNQNQTSSENAAFEGGSNAQAPISF